MSQQLTRAIDRAYVTATRLHAMYTALHEHSGLDRDLRQREQQWRAIEYLRPIVDALPDRTARLIRREAMLAETAGRADAREEIDRVLGVAS